MRARALLLYGPIEIACLFARQILPPPEATEYIFSYIGHTSRSFGKFLQQLEPTRNLLRRES